MGYQGATAQEIWADPDPVITVLEQTGIAAASTAAVGTAAYLALTRKRRELMREWVLPLHEALALPLRLPEQTDPRRYLHIPRKFSEDDAVIRVDVPGREIVAAAKESAPVIGIGSAGRIVTVDLDAESPHILFNASTGGGKSVTLRCIACQMLHHGSLVFVLDTKRISHPWAHGVDGVTYCRDIADIHDQLIALGMEGRRRTRVADELGIDADPKAIGPRLLILLEEVNATMKQLARYWEKTRESGDPKVSRPSTRSTRSSTWAASCAYTSSWSPSPPPPAPSVGPRSASSSPPASSPATASTPGACSPRRSTRRRSPPSTPAAPRSSSAAPPARPRCCSSPRPKPASGPPPARRPPTRSPQPYRRSPARYSCRSLPPTPPPTPGTPRRPRPRPIQPRPPTRATTRPAPRRRRRLPRPTTTRWWDCARPTSTTCRTSPSGRCATPAPTTARSPSRSTSAELNSSTASATSSAGHATGPALPPAPPTGAAHVDRGVYFRVSVVERFQRFSRMLANEPVKLCRPTSGELLISDEPALALRDGHLGTGPHDGLGLEDCDELVLPLGPQLIAVLGAGHGYATIGADEVDRYSTVQVRAAADYIHMRPGSGLEAFTRDAVTEDWPNRISQHLRQGDLPATFLRHPAPAH